eukprot:111559-Prymnesium_polylepis.1
MSTSICWLTPGCSTFTATVNHSSLALPSTAGWRNRPRYTCAMHPEPMGVRSSSRCSRQLTPNMRSRLSTVCSHGCAGVLP